LDHDAPLGLCLSSRLCNISVQTAYFISGLDATMRSLCGWAVYSQSSRYQRSPSTPRLLVGSSSNTMRESEKQAIASLTRCFIPDEKYFTTLWAAASSAK